MAQFRLHGAGALTCELALEDQRLLDVSGVNIDGDIQCHELVALLLKMGESEDDAEETGCEMTSEGPLAARTWLDVLRKLSQSEDPEAKAKISALLVNPEGETEEALLDTKRPLSPKTLLAEDDAREMPADAAVLVNVEMQDTVCITKQPAGSRIVKRNGSVNGRKVCVSMCMCVCLYVFVCMSVCACLCASVNILASPCCC
jgi:hypothetical protein